MNIHKTNLFFRNCLGFSLLEAMVVVAIIAIMAAAAAGGLGSLVPRSEAKSVAQQLRADLNRARMEAVRSNRNALVRFSVADAAGPGVFEACFDGDGDGQCTQSPEDIMIARLDLAGADYRHVEIASANFTNGNYFWFNPLGMPAGDNDSFSSGSVVVNCASDDGYSLSIIVSRSGRIRIE